MGAICLASTKKILTSIEDFTGKRLYNKTSFAEYLNIKYNGRFYHNIYHIDYMINVATSTFFNLGSIPQQISFIYLEQIPYDLKYFCFLYAILMHDVYYKVKCKFNEEISALIAVNNFDKFVEHITFGPGNKEEMTPVIMKACKQFITTLILATKHNGKYVNSLYHKLIIDLDLLGFTGVDCIEDVKYSTDGSGQHEIQQPLKRDELLYKTNTLNIRKEYKKISNIQWARGRISFLLGMMVKIESRTLYDSFKQYFGENNVKTLIEFAKLNIEEEFLVHQEYITSYSMFSWLNKKERNKIYYFYDWM